MRQLLLACLFFNQIENRLDLNWFSPYSTHDQLVPLNRPPGNNKRDYKAELSTHTD